MVKKTDPGPKLNEALLELADSGMLSEAAAIKITMRVLGAPSKPDAPLPKEIRALRETANMSQAVFARLLNVTPGYVSQLERGAKRPTGPAVALLNVIKRKGIQVMY